MEIKLCKVCAKVHLGPIANPGEYVLCLNSMLKMIKDGDAEMTFQSCPPEKMLTEDSHWTRNKYFHQFRCTHCGKIYGMLYNINTGGIIKLNAKVFDPKDYPDVPPKGEQ